MQYTPNYNLTIAEGADAVNPLTQIFPNFSLIDSAMEDNKEGGIGTASEVTTGGVHAIVRTDPTIPVFRYTATSAWTTGDTMTLDGSAVTVHLSDGTAPKSGTYVIGAEVLAVVNGSLVTLLTSKDFDGVVSFNSRAGVVTPQSGDYTANQIGYNNTGSGLVASDVQNAIDEVASRGHIYSNTERVIGTWLGETLYEKTVNCGTMGNSATTTTPHGVANLKNVVSYDSIAVRTNESFALPTPDVYVFANATNISIQTQANWSGYTAYVTIRYTKTA